MKLNSILNQFIRIISDFKQHARIKNVVLICIMSVLLFACKDSETEAISQPRAQDDFYTHINKDWLANTEIPEELPGIENFSLLTLDVYQQLYDTYQELNKNTGNLKSYEQKFVNFFNSYMNQARRDSLGASAIQGELDRINSIQSHKEMALLFADFQKIGIVGPIVITVFANPVKSDERTIAVLQYGLELTQQELLGDDERSQKKRELYAEHVGNYFALSGMDNPEERANRAVNVERALAEIQWSPTENRGPRKKYNPHTEDEFAALLSNVPIHQMLKILGYGDRAEYIVQQPSYFKALNSLFVKTDLDAWKDYFTMKLLNDRSAILSKAFDDENMAYKMKKGESAKSMESWLRGMLYVGDNADMMVGRVYIDHHFNEEKLQQITDIVKTIQDEYRIAIKNNTLFSEATKKEAMNKLDNMQFYVGYPKEWKNYSDLEIDPNDLVGNVRRIALFNHNNTISDLSETIDPDVWSNSPTEVNAFYQPSANKFVLIGSILQSPFFDSSWDKVRNIGGIGYIIWS